MTSESMPHQDDAPELGEMVDLSWQRKALDAADIRTITGALVELALGLEKLVRAVRAEGRSEGSAAADHVAWPGNPENAEGSTHVASAQASMLTSCLAATDHMRAFVQGVRSGRTVSSWTVARGTVEAFAPAHYTLTSESPEHFFGRHIGLVLAETYHDRDKLYAYRHGPMQSVGEYRAAFTELARERGITPPARNETSMTSLVTGLLDAVAAGSAGRARYSHLSSVAHGQAPGINMFIPDLDGPMVLPGVLGFEAAHLQAACAVHVGDALIAYFAPVTRTAERWRQARDRATGSLIAHGLGAASNVVEDA